MGYDKECTVNGNFVKIVLIQETDLDWRIITRVCGNRTSRLYSKYVKLSESKT